MCAVCISCGKCSGNPIPRMAVGKCPFCGTENGQGALVCASCGAPLPQPPGGPSADTASARGDEGD